MLCRWNNASHGYMTIKSMDSCINKWTLKIHGDMIVIGVTSNFNINTPFQWDKRQLNYSYLGGCGDVGRNGSWKPYDRPYEYRSRAYSENDIIEVILDLNKRTISFTKNGKEFGVAWNNVPKKPDLAFKLVITVRNQGDGATIMDFQQSFPKK